MFFQGRIFLKNLDIGDFHKNCTNEDEPIKVGLSLKPKM